MIWRDDDIGDRTKKLESLRAVDDLFQRYKVPHTVAIMAAGLDKWPELVDLIKERGMIPQLHCWTHSDLTEDIQARADLAKAVDLIERLTGTRPTTLYPPWNRSDPVVVDAARALGLSVSWRKISLAQYINAGGDVQEQTINLHFWHVPDVALLDRALRIATGRPE